MVTTETASRQFTAGQGCPYGGEGGCDANRNECSRGRSLLHGQVLDTTQDHRTTIEQWWAVGVGWWLVAAGGGRWAVGGWWWRAAGGWWLVAVGGWRLAVGGPYERSFTRQKRGLKDSPAAQQLLLPYLQLPGPFPSSLRGFPQGDPSGTRNRGPPLTPPAALRCRLSPNCRRQPPSTVGYTTNAASTWPGVKRQRPGAKRPKGAQQATGTETRARGAEGRRRDVRIQRRRGGGGIRPWCWFACLWPRLLAFRHCSF